jgi:hypothetical protein
MIDSKYLFYVSVASVKKNIAKGMGKVKQFIDGLDLSDV